jgi:hypothetical protein
LIRPVLNPFQNHTTLRRNYITLITGTGVPPGLSATTVAGTYTTNFVAPPSTGTYTLQTHFAGQGIFEPSSSVET